MLVRVTSEVRVRGRGALRGAGGAGLKVTRD